uniref:MS115, putative beta-agarase n=1 Tax=Microscilla sp. PRE1 TaxID=155537 RepID=Q934I7_9BACT|nr:Ig-like domain-containing protein [Microscilla sp. PRE1]AAK62837.1 MS115, putative beta-agarase precursor [Microscilla sp. PRE1]
MYGKVVLFTVLFLGNIFCLYSQGVQVDVNLNVKHSVGGVSDFGRDRHMTVHSSLTEPDWQGEEAKMDYLLTDLDTYLGRDNGSATWKFASTPQDPNNPHHPSVDSMQAFGDWLKGEYESLTNRHQYESRASGMIMGTNAHPTYPTLSWYANGSTWTDPQWQPKDVQTSADWVTEYLDKFFAHSPSVDGEPLPKYWEVVNEPDMEYMTGKFMVTSQEKIWEYHNLVAQGVKERLGTDAPLIGGMTWGLHDLFAGDGLSRYQPDYLDQYLDAETAEFYRNAAATQWPGNQNQPWYQWDVQWKGFIDAAGANMDFYSVHFYDWPTYNASGGAVRSGGHVEATLDMLEWYDVQKFGVSNRKPVVISEYGAVQGSWTYLPHDNRYDWECIKPFNSMLMQFLERPDYIIYTLPFTPIKAQWGDVDQNGDGTPEYVYQYKLMRDDDHDGNWEWSDYIKFYELWSEVKGTRIDTKSTDPDIQIDAYVDGKDVFLILNNLENQATTIHLNLYEDFGNNVQNVNIKHLHLTGTSTVTLDNNDHATAPESVQLAGDGTMVIKYTYGSAVNINHNSIEKKFYGESLSGTVPNRVSIPNGEMTMQINGVDVPADASKAEAMLRITCALYNDDDNQVGHLSIDKLTVNGTEIETPLDWRGTNQVRNRYFSTLEIPVPVGLLQTNNTFTVDFHHVGEVAVVNLQTWEFSKVPGRSTSSDPVAVTGVTVSPGSPTVAQGSTVQMTAHVQPTNATDQSVTWSSSNANVASVNASGEVTGIAQGTATITATTNDGGFIASTQVMVTTGDVDVTGVSVTPTSASLLVGQSIDLTETVSPTNATDKSVTWTTSNSAVVTVNGSGLVTAKGNGSATVTVTTNDGGFTAQSAVTVTTGGGGSAIVIEAESFTSTGGTTDDSPYGGPGIGVNNAGTNINYVNSEDWAEYGINVSEAGTYQIEYQISTPSNNAQVRFELDGNVVSTDNVPNNGQWDSYTKLIAGSTISTLSTGSHTVRLVASGANAWQWNLDKVTLTKTGSSTVNVTGVSASPTNVSLSIGGSTDLTETVNPGNATDKSVSWSSNNTAVATVDANGLVSAVGAGTAVITVTTSDGGHTATCSVTVSGGNSVELTIQAEDFATTGGTHDGFQVYSVNGVTATNWNQTGDWADYSVTIPEAGDYSIEYFMGTTVNGAAVTISVDGAVQRTDAVPNNGNWDVFESLKVGGRISLNAGSHTIRLLGDGTNGWEWNMDRFVLSKGAASSRVESSSSSQIVNQGISIYPVPADDKITVRGLAPDLYQLTISNVSGKIVRKMSVEGPNDYILDVGDLKTGVYFLHFHGSKTTFNARIIMQH